MHACAAPQLFFFLYLRAMKTCWFSLSLALRRLHLCWYKSPTFPAAILGFFFFLSFLMRYDILSEFPKRARAAIGFTITRDKKEVIHGRKLHTMQRVESTHE